LFWSVRINTTWRCPTTHVSREPGEEYTNSRMIVTANVLFGCARAGKMREGALRKKYCHKTIHQDLSRDHPKIAFVAVRTVVVIEHIYSRMPGRDSRKDLARGVEAAAVEVQEVLQCRAHQRE
jgi:hypothetical protein